MNRYMVGMVLALLLAATETVAGQIRQVASSIAVSPPPTPVMTFSLQKKPSHVAQADTPLPMNSFSESSPSHLAVAPVDTMTLFPK